MELEEYLKECNLVFTNTISSYDFSRVDFDPRKAIVNYQDCFSLYHLFLSFNRLYLAFKKEYDALEKLDLGKKIEVIKYSKFTIKDDNYRLLLMGIDEPSITKHADTILFLREINGEIKPFVTNYVGAIPTKGSYRDNISLPPDIAKKYLDLFEKYNLLLEVFWRLRNCQVFGDGTFSIFARIDNTNANLLAGLDTLEIFFGSLYFNAEYFVKIPVKLSENFKIDYPNCQTFLNQEVKLNDTQYDQILRGVYINKDKARIREK